MKGATAPYGWVKLFVFSNHDVCFSQFTRWTAHYERNSN
jgi:hypothetical protein